MSKVTIIAILGGYGDSYKVVVLGSDNSTYVYDCNNDGYNHINMEVLDSCTRSRRIAKKWHPKLYH